MADGELPLFPLNIVLFPEMALQLHVFEPRYVQLVEECVAADHRFGIVLLREGPDVTEAERLAGAGTVALIQECQRAGEKRYRLLVSGEGRFRIGNLRAEGDRLFAEVEYYDDDPDSLAEADDTIEEVRSYARERLRLIREALGRSLFDESLPVDPAELSFGLAASVEMTLDERQKLLELTDTSVRLTILRDRLRGQVEKLSHRREIHDTAERTRGNNGRLTDDHIDQQVLRQFED